MIRSKRILFLCTGNYYRSRYAEELFNFHARKERLGWQAISRGVAENSSPENVGPMSRYTIEALSAKGIAPSGATRYPRSCSLSDFDEAQLTIALKETEHRLPIEQRFPSMASRVTYWHVDDIELARPADALGMIENGVQELISMLKATAEHI